MGKKVFFSILLLAAITFVSAEALFGFTDAENRSVEIPNFCGLQEEALAVPDWVSLKTEYRYDRQAPIGHVIAQSPPAGSLRKITERHPCEISITVSLGEEQVTLPEYKGQNAASAASSLRNLGFSVREVRISGGTDGTVAHLEPPSGSRLPVGSTVTLYLYEADAAQSVAVPDFTGLTRENALMQIFLSGLRAGEILEESSSEFDGTVIRQSPTPGSYAAENTPVKLVISKQTFDSSSPFYTAERKGPICTKVMEPLQKVWADSLLSSFSQANLKKSQRITYPLRWTA